MPTTSCHASTPPLEGYDRPASGSAISIASRISWRAQTQVQGDLDVAAKLLAAVLAWTVRTEDEQQVPWCDGRGAARSSR